MRKRDGEGVNFCSSESRIGLRGTEIGRKRCFHFFFSPPHMPAGKAISYSLSTCLQNNFVLAFLKYSDDKVKLYVDAKELLKR
jgi:hypothetical protein